MDDSKRDEGVCSSNGEMENSQVKKRTVPSSSVTNTSSRSDSEDDLVLMMESVLKIDLTDDSDDAEVKPNACEKKDSLAVNEISMYDEPEENCENSRIKTEKLLQRINDFFLKEELLEERAHAFVRHLVTNRLINTESGLTKDKLESLYDSYSSISECDSSDFIFPFPEILLTFRSIDVIKYDEKSNAYRNDDSIEFKENIFLIRNNDENRRPSTVEIHRLKNEENNLTYVIAEFKCRMCQQSFKNRDDLHDHYFSRIHILKKLHRHNRSWFISKVKNLKFDKVGKTTIETNEQKNIEIVFENVAVDCDFIHIIDVFELVSLKEVKTEYSTKSQIEKGGIFKITLDVNFTQYGAGIFPIVIQLLENNCEEFKYLLIEPTFDVISKKVPKSYNRPPTTENFFETQASKRCIIREKPKPLKRCIILDNASIFPGARNRTAYLNRDQSVSDAAIFPSRGGNRMTFSKKDDGKPTKWGFRNRAGRNAGMRRTPFTSSEDDKKEVISAPRIAREIEIPKLRLSPNEIPTSLKTLFKLGVETISNFSLVGSDIVEKFQKIIFEPDTNKILSNEIALSIENYVDRFHFIMWIEEFTTIQEIRTFNQENVYLLSDRRNEKLMGVSLPGLAEGRPSVLKGDTVIITPKGYDNKFEGIVETVEEESIYVRMDNKFFMENLWKHPVNVNFRFNRTPLKMSHNALDEIRRLNMEEITFPKSYEEDVKSVELKPFFNQSIEGNELQKQAIKNILENRAYPAPYILFGPPGTGKTATLVEAIAQIWSVFDDAKICVCASSNAAADVIACRLLNYIPANEMVRIYGLSRSDAEITPELRNCCNFDPRVREVYFPSISELGEKRVVVMTPVTAGRLVLSGIHFDYLFMDEAGHTVEVDMMIPIVGFLKKNISQHRGGSLILAGDPKQLGPVVRSPTAIACGFGMSFLERLMSQCDLYKKDPITSKYNPKVITKLINNYRSHEKILQVPNSRFYDNELVAKASEERTSGLCQWKTLPTPNFPLIFHSVKGKEERESNSPSYFNTQEINIVEKYVKDLFDSKKHEIEESDLGIISPYRKQVRKIRQRLSRLWPNINVASVEEFQGQERKIIIISTVRSRHELIASDYKYGLGFLKNEKRFNVAITRAMSLLIVIGNPDVLQCDPNWRAFLEYCKENSTFVGEPASGVLPPDFDQMEKVVSDLTDLKI